MSTPIHAITDHQWATMAPAAIASITGTTARNVHQYRARHAKPAAPTKRGRPPGTAEKPPYTLTPAAAAQRAAAAQSAGRKAGENPHRSTLYRRAKRAAAATPPH